MRVLAACPLLALLLLLQVWESQPQAAGPKCHTGPLDLVFVIDSSRSVRPFEFETVRQFLVGLLRSLDVGLNATRVGVIQYSSQVQSVFPLGAFSHREDMERALRALVPLAQGTMTGLAIQYAMNVAFSVAEGARPPEQRVPRIAVIVTDGRPQDRVSEVAAQARARGIEIYAVGVQRADVGSLRAMASPPLEEHVFLVESFDLIQEFGRQLHGRLCVRDLCNGVDHGCEFECVSEGLTYRCLCPEGWQLQADGKSCTRCHEGHVDLVLLVDGSKSVRPQNFELVKRFVNQIVDFLDVSPEGTRVGLVQFSSRVRTEFPLGRYGTAAEIKQAVLAVEYMERGTMTGLALRHMVEHSFSEAQGARPRALHVPRVGLVFTDGRSQDDISVWAARAKEEGIVMYAVGVGKAVEEELRTIASEPAELHVSYSPDFNTMTHLLENLKGSICPEEGIGAGTELRSPCDCESLVEFQGRTLGTLDSLTQKLAQLSVRLENLENVMGSQK
ncbi:matrilin-4 isoform X3 [Ochotona curzoniae]|uniref:matrilin-4 isoform X3 n=1 Tax=Ochotona curzoniae TaxID=130825 RepID=UPI001B3520F8|nr:matrilin-4 isoform X3 [Ochotona curzoniae]